MGLSQPRYFGPYTVTLRDVTGLKLMVSNFGQQYDDRVVHHPVGNTQAVEEPVEIEEDGDTVMRRPTQVREQAIRFTTGSHSAGYTLDSIAADIWIVFPPTDGVAIVIEDDTDPANDRIQIEQPEEDDIFQNHPFESFPRPRITIHTGTTDTYRDGLSLYATHDQPDLTSTVCELEGLADYTVGTPQVSNPETPDRLYASGCDLEATTTYWFVFRSADIVGNFGEDNDDDVPGSFYNVGMANSADVGFKDPGWDIGDYLYSRAYSDFLVDWTKRTDEGIFPYTVAIWATPK